jgi:hypothetical protein
MTLVLGVIVALIAINFIKGYFKMIFDAVGFNDI